MDANDFQLVCLDTAIYPRVHAVTYPAMGLAGEAGEIANKVKKFMRSGIIRPDEIRDEVGDVLWYSAALLHDLHFTMNDAMNAVVEKLQSRKARGTLEGSGDKR